MASSVLVRVLVHCAERTHVQRACAVVYIQHNAPSMWVGVTGAVATGLFIGFLPSDWLGEGPQVHGDRLKLTCRWVALKYSHFNMMQQGKAGRQPVQSQQHAS